MDPTLEEIVYWLPKVQTTWQVYSRDRSVTSILCAAPEKLQIKLFPSPSQCASTGSPSPSTDSDMSGV